MKIGILLPYKENFSPEYPGAVSLFVYETSINSKYKKNIIVFGNTTYKKKFNLKYENIPLSKSLFASQTKNYVKKFINQQRKFKFSIIEIHNRPGYVKQLNKYIKKSVFSLYFHNDPLSMDGSKTVKERKNLLNICYKIIFNSNWSKKRFLEGIGGRTLHGGICCSLRWQRNCRLSS